MVARPAEQYQAIILIALYQSSKGRARVNVSGIIFGITRQKIERIRRVGIRILWREQDKSSVQTDAEEIRLRDLRVPAERRNTERRKVRAIDPESRTGDVGTYIFRGIGRLNELCDYLCDERKEADNNHDRYPAPRHCMSVLATGLPEISEQNVFVAHTRDTSAVSFKFIICDLVRVSPALEKSHDSAPKHQICKRPCHCHKETIPGCVFP